MGPGASPGLDAYGDAFVCQTAALAEKAAPACNNVGNVGAWVRAILHSGTGVEGGPPGNLTDGIYRATELDGYRGAADTEVRDTVAVTQGGTVVLWSGEVFNPTTGVTTTVLGNATASGSSAAPTFEVSCGAVPFAPFVAMSTTPTWFFLETAIQSNSERVYEELFTLTDCAPGD